jgi:LemA protein
MWMSVAAAVVALGFVWIFNSLVRRKNDVETCWGAIDAYLKKRFDLVPNLVSAVQNYMTHEKDTLEKLVRLREQSMTSGWSPEAAVRSDADVASALRQVMVRAEAYPELKANQNFLQLQDELVDTEDKIQAARRFYNGSARDFNSHCNSTTNK